MTTVGDVLELRVLGPLEATLGGDDVPLGGAKQRAVLAVLLIRHGEVVPLERLVDEIWGDDPPPSALRALESYVSRLRQVLNGHGPTLIRRGGGYVVELGGAALDAVAFAELHERASEAAARGDHRRVVDLTGAALRLWRGPALADVVLASRGRAAAERLEEARLRTYELLFDAELALDGHDRVVGELRALVRECPYRERFVADLMLALYRSGRHAEALDVYERTRDTLSRDLGLQPSVELRQLSGQIVRQDPRLRRPAPVPPPIQAPGVIAQRSRRVATLVLAGAALAAAMAFTASGSAPRPDAPAPVPIAKRVALVLPRAPATAPIDDVRVRRTAAAFREYTAAWDHESQIFAADETESSPAELERIVQRVEAGDFALVLVMGGGATARAFEPIVRRLSGTRFAFIDASLASVSLERVPNATGVPFADQQSSELVGYLSGLVPPRRGPSHERADLVSIVAARKTPRVERLVRAFGRGVRRALPTVGVSVDYVSDERNKTACERLANDQIDAGSDVVYAIAGRCSSAALEVARVRGVWGIRVNDDAVADSPHIIATTHKQWDTAVEEILNGYALDTLPRGDDRMLGLADDYAVDAWGNDLVEVRSAWSKVVRLCSRLRQRSEDADS